MIFPFQRVDWTRDLPLDITRWHSQSSADVMCLEDLKCLHSCHDTERTHESAFSLQDSGGELDPHSFQVQAQLKCCGAVTLLWGGRGSL